MDVIVFYITLLVLASKLRSFNLQIGFIKVGFGFSEQKLWKFSRDEDAGNSVREIQD